MSATNWPIASVALPHAIHREIDSLVERMRSDSPGVTVTRSDALRTLILRGLQAERTPLSTT